MHLRSVDRPRIPDRNPLLTAQLPTYRALFIFCLIAAVPLIATTQFQPEPMETRSAFLTGMIGTVTACLVPMRSARRYLALVLVVGSILAAVAFARGYGLLEGLACIGFTAFLGVALHHVHDRDARARTTPILLAAALLPIFFVAGVGWTELTRRCLPRVLDSFVYYADTTLYVHSFHVGQLFARFPFIVPVARYVYSLEWLALLLLWNRQLVDPRPRMDLLAATIFGSILGITSYYLFPVIGPEPAFGPAFPHRPPPGSAVFLRAIVGLPAMRNCVPSMHNAWALLLWWHGRPYERPIRALTWFIVVMTVLATLGFGYHYVIDIFVAWPTALAIQALVTFGDVRKRRRAFVIGVTTLLAWMIVLRFGYRALSVIPGLTWALGVATIVSSYLLERELQSTAVALVEHAAAPSAPRSWPILAMFLASGFSGLAYEVMFSKALGLVFGNTASALTIVLATYMGGMALGSFFGGRVAEKSRRPLRLYALCEVATAALCFTAPRQLTLLRDVYVRLAAGADPARPSLSLLRLALEVVVLLPPTILMGMTLPIMFAHIRRTHMTTGQSIARLYAANTTGAAIGAFATGYFLLPTLGGRGTVIVAVAINLVVALIAFMRERAPSDPIPPEPIAAARGDVRLGWFALLLAGVLTIALETVYDHLLSVVVGASVYAFATMLFAFLVGLASGAALLGRLGVRAHRREAIAILAAVLGAIVLLTNIAWAAVPGYFASFEGYPFGQSFIEREFIRTLICVLISAPPALCLGALFVVSMAHAAGDGSPGRVGVASAINTLGNITGAIVAGFVLLPRLGSLRTAQVLAGIALAVAIVAARGRFAWGAIALCSIAVAVQPRGFDIDRLASGSSVYFRQSPWGRAIDWAESRDGGITTVTLLDAPGVARTKTLLTNGKFQGNDTGEVDAQYGFALTPSLHTERRDRALVIGYGTGASTHVLAQEFGRVDVAELTNDIVRLADRHFAHINGLASQRPNVSLHITDGRNLLMLSRERYDIVSIEISSIWLRGAASLYNQELYALVRDRLTETGVLQQWIQLHHMQVSDMVSIVATMRSVFPVVHLYERGGQGILIGCRAACSPRRSELAKSLLLDPTDVDRMLADFRQRGVDVDELISTDDNMLLEYSTPKGNVLNDNLVDFVRKFRR